MVLLALTTSLLLSGEPVPLEMPCAEAYFVSEGAARRLEDRYRRDELWISRTIDGRWMDEEGRLLVLATLATKPPASIAEGRRDEDVASAEQAMTRLDYAKGEDPILKKDLAAVRTALTALSPVEVPKKSVAIRQLPRGYDDVDYWQGTNRQCLVCTYRFAKDPVWHMASWELAEGDDFDECRELFEDEFLAKTLRRHPMSVRPAATETSEREALRTDARHSVTNYAAWHCTDGEGFTVIDDLPSGLDFVVTLTNDLRRARQRFVETVPTGLDGSNVLSVVRLYGTHAEYQLALEMGGLTNMSWSAAYWDIQRRELVAFLTDTGDSESLLDTLRHEAFHQYLSYATSFIPVSPWLNEGYAQYFAAMDETLRDSVWWQDLGNRPDVERLIRYADVLPLVMEMDYDAFYDGTDGMRRLNYALALSIAQFLEQGADKVRFQPFKDVKKRYFAALFDRQDMREATRAAFESEEKLNLFKREWVKFFRDM